MNLLKDNKKTKRTIDITFWLLNRPAIFFLLMAIIAFCLLLYFDKLDENFSWHDLLVEAHGMLYDLIVFGIILAIYDSLKNRNEKITRYKEELEDYRGWKGEEARFRVNGLIRRCNNLNFTNLDISNLYLVGSSLTNANLKKAKANGVDFSESILSETIFDYSSLVSAKFNNTKLDDVSFRNCDLTWAKFKNPEINRTSFDNSKLVGVEFSNIRFPFIASFKNSNLKRAKFLNCSLSSIEFSSCEIWNTQFKDSSIFNTDFTKIIFHHSEFINVKFIGNNFKDVSLSASNFENCDFRDWKFENSKEVFTNNFQGANFLNVNLNNVKVDSSDWIEKLEKLNVAGIESIKSNFVVSKNYMKDELGIPYYLIKEKKTVTNKS